MTMLDISGETLMKTPSEPDMLRDYDRSLLKSSLLSLFWAVISDRRGRGKYTLQQVADSVGTDKSVVSRWFAKPPNWRLDSVSDVASALGLDLEFRARERATGRIFSPSGHVDAAVVGSGGVKVTSAQGPSLKLIHLGYDDPRRSA